MPHFTCKKSFSTRRALRATRHFVESDSSVRFRDAADGGSFDSSFILSSFEPPKPFTLLIARSKPTVIAAEELTPPPSMRTPIGNERATPIHPSASFRFRFSFLSFSHSSLRTAAAPRASAPQLRSVVSPSSVTVPNGSRTSKRTSPANASERSRTFVGPTDSFRSAPTESEFGDGTKPKSTPQSSAMPATHPPWWSTCAPRGHTRYGATATRTSFGSTGTP
mmetsp:Transcript_683/g.2608  ORF Transcript_683/g.2608 Transcript_683/m.2608 type:complete len:222 (+) Transcript_683:912-1577(+)